MHQLGMRHQYEQKALRPQPKKSAYVRFLDRATLIIGIIGPFVVVPQIYSIFSTQSAEGVSLMTWFLMVVVNLPWVLYGIAHKNKALIISFTLWEIFNGMVMLGVILYG